MTTLDYSLLEEGMQVLVSSDSTLADSIQWAQYKKNYIGIKVNHIGILHKDNTGQWWVSEEKRLIGGIGNTMLEEYIQDDVILIFRKPIVNLVYEEIQRLDFIITKYTGKKRYRWGGLFTELYQYLRFKITGVNKEVNYKPKDGIFICSEWYGFAIDYATGRFPDWKGKSPSDWQYDTRFRDVMIYFSSIKKSYLI